MKTKHRFGYSLDRDLNEDFERSMRIKNQYGQVLDTIEFESDGNYNQDIEVASDLLEQWIEHNGEYYEWGQWYV